MIYYDAAICGYWSYEQDILVGFYDSFLTEFEITAGLITESSKYCRKYRNADYNQAKYDGVWIMPEDAITPSASMIVAPRYLAADCTGVDGSTFSTGAAGYLETHPENFRNCMASRAAMALPRGPSALASVKLDETAKGSARFTIAASALFPGSD